MSAFLQQLINGLMLGGLYALIALGYTMVYGIIELINFAHGEVVHVRRVHLHHDDGHEITRFGARASADARR